MLKTATNHKEYQLKIIIFIFNFKHVCGSNIHSHFFFREYVSSKTINKVIQVHDRIFCCIAGSLADAQAVIKAAKFHLSFHRYVVLQKKHVYHTQKYVLVILLFHFLNLMFTTLLVSYIL